MRTSDYLIHFMKMEEDSIFHQFSSLRKVEINNVYPRWLYVPGTREDKVLLVAHTDTVWSGPPKRVAYRNGVLYNADLVHTIENNRYFLEGEGIGADDRSGIAMLWALRKSGHSLLLIEGEEIGIGSYTAAYDPFIQDIVEEHCYAVEFDRGGTTDVVFYNNEPKEFKEFVKQETGYVEAVGSFTDIKVICDNRINSFNISVGYNHAHQPNEMQVVAAWEQTYKIISKMLSKKQKKWEI